MLDVLATLPLLSDFFIQIRIHSKHRIKVRSRSGSKSKSKIISRQTKATTTTTMTIIMFFRECTTGRYSRKRLRRKSLLFLSIVILGVAILTISSVNNISSVKYDFSSSGIGDTGSSTEITAQKLIIHNYDITTTTIAMQFDTSNDNASSSSSSKDTRDVSVALNSTTNRTYTAATAIAAAVVGNNNSTLIQRNDTVTDHENRNDTSSDLTDYSHHYEEKLRYTRKREHSYVVLEGLYQRRSKLDEIFEPHNNYDALGNDAISNNKASSLLVLSAASSNTTTLQSLVQLPSSNAICEFRHVGNWMGWPHTFQQLLRCVSWWLVASESESESDHESGQTQRFRRRPYLIPYSMRHYSAWSKDFISIVAQQFDLQLDYKGAYVNTSVHAKAVPNTPTHFIHDYKHRGRSTVAPAYQMVHPHQAERMRQWIYNYYNIQQQQHHNQHDDTAANVTAIYLNENVPLSSFSSSSSSASAPSSGLKRKLTIGFLNRNPKDGRHTVNYDSIITSLKNHQFFGFINNDDDADGTATMNNTNATVGNNNDDINGNSINATRKRKKKKIKMNIDTEVTYLDSFDGLTFHEQINFISQIVRAVNQKQKHLIIQYIATFS